MKQVKLAALIGLICFSCNQPKSEKTSALATISASVRNPKTDTTYKKATLGLTDNKAQLQKLVRSVYEWHETKSSMDDFDPLADKQQIRYMGIDKKKLNNRLNELKATNYFDGSFLDNYKSIGLTLDGKLKNKQLEWSVGDMPPFGNDSNPWCNCQDSPENYWKTLALINLNIDNDKATFGWTWGDDSIYKVKAKKSNGVWQISYLQGFDPTNFIPSN
ncbi:hypothetical protein [Spirosoma aerophilum]